MILLTVLFSIVKSSVQHSQRLQYVLSDVLLVGHVGKEVWNKAMAR